MSSLFKRAAVRGVAHELVTKGLCEFPSKEAMDTAADAVADGRHDDQAALGHGVRHAPAHRLDAAVAGGG